MKRVLLEVMDYIKIILIALIITNIINVFVFNISQVKHSSMESTLYPNEHLIIEKISYTFGHPKRGDIIVFVDEEDVNDSISGRFARLYEDIFSKIKGKDGHNRLVKRIVGLPGDEVNILEGDVYINGEKLEEPYLTVSTGTKGITYPLIVPKDCYFVLGDNRTVSLDSRDFGCVPEEKIEGKLLVRFWPLNKLGGVK